MTYKAHDKKEISYTVIDKEFLVISFRSKKWYEYMYGNNIIIEANNRLLSIMLKPIN